jgi:hypothetical protein
MARTVAGPIIAPARSNRDFRHSSPFFKSTTSGRYRHHAGSANLTVTKKNGFTAVAPLTNSLNARLKITAEIHREQAHNPTRPSIFMAYPVGLLSYADQFGLRE